MPTAHLNATIPAEGAPGPGWANDVEDYEEKADATHRYSATGYGVTADGTTDDATALGLVLAAAKGTGGIVDLPEGTIKIASTITTLNDSQKPVVIQGAGGANAGYAGGTRIEFTPSSGSLFELKSSFGVRFVNCQMVATHASYSGYLLKTDHGTLLSDTSHLGLEHCYLEVNSAASGSCMDLGKSINGSYRHTVFYGGATSIRCATTNYSNVHHFDHCWFGGYGTVAFRDAGQSVMFTCCTFQQGVGGVGAAYTQSDYYAYSLVFLGCWFGDSTSGTWIENVKTNGGLLISGNFFGSGALALSLRTGCSGASINGNAFYGTTTGISALGSVTGISITGNTFQGTTPIANYSNFDFGTFIAGNYHPTTGVPDRFNNVAGLGFFDSTPVVQQASAAVATDLASVVALANALRTALLNYGLTA